MRCYIWIKSVTNESITKIKNVLLPIITWNYDVYQHVLKLQLFVSSVFNWPSTWCVPETLTFILHQKLSLFKCRKSRRNFGNIKFIWEHWLSIYKSTSWLNLLCTSYNCGWSLRLFYENIYFQLSWEHVVKLEKNWLRIFQNILFIPAPKNRMFTSVTTFQLFCVS